MADSTEAQRRFYAEVRDIADELIDLHRRDRLALCNALHGAANRFRRAVTGSIVGSWDEAARQSTADDVRSESDG